MTPEVVELEVPARHDYLSVVRSVVTAAAQAVGLGSTRLDDLRLAVSEACANAVDAHRSAGTDAAIEVTCAVEGSTITVTVRDRGLGFDTGADRALPEPGDPTRLGHERGLGLSLMRSLADGIELQSGPAGTTVALTFHAS